MRYDLLIEDLNVTDMMWGCIFQASINVKDIVGDDATPRTLTRENKIVFDRISDFQKKFMTHVESQKDLTKRPDAFEEAYLKFFKKEVLVFLKQFQLFDEFTAEQSSNSCITQQELLLQFLKGENSSPMVTRARDYLIRQVENGHNPFDKEVAQEIDDSITHRDGKAEVSDPPTVLRTKENPQPDPASHIMRDEKIGGVKPRGPRDLANAGKSEFQTVCDSKKTDTRKKCYCQNVAIFSEKKEGGREVPLCGEHMNLNADGKYLH